MRASILAVLIASFDPSADPEATHQAAVVKVRMGPSWCHDKYGVPYRCETIQPSVLVTSWLQGNCVYISDDDDVAPGELLMIFVRAMRDGVSSSVCTHDGGPDDCGTVEYSEVNASCP